MLEGNRIVPGAGVGKGAVIIPTGVPPADTVQKVQRLLIMAAVNKV